MEASALSHAARRGLLTRKSPLLKMQGDERLVALVRSGNQGAFDIIVDRYQARLLGFCRQMVGSTEDAEDVLQEVFVNAHKAILADNREINLRPWLYRIARNRSLNHLRKPKAVAQESMDLVPITEAASTAEKVHNREEFRQLLQDVTKLPETQRAALLLREIDELSYEEIAVAMDTTVPSVKSLLVRARISLAEASQARMLTCGEVRVELAEAAEGLTKASGPVRKHVRDCEECAAFRKQLRSDTKVLAMLSPVGPLLALKALLAGKIGFGGGAAGAGSAVTGGASATAGAGAVGASGAAASGISAVTGAVGAKAIAGVVTAAVITAGAVEVKRKVVGNAVNDGVNPTPRTIAAAHPAKPAVAHTRPKPAREAVPVVDEPEVTPAEADPAVEAEVPTEPAAEVLETAPPPPATEMTETDPQPSTATNSPTGDVSENGGDFEGSVVDVPDRPTVPAGDDPSAPVTTPTQPTAPQVPDKTSPPAVNEPTAPITPGPSAPVPGGTAPARPNQ